MESRVPRKTIEAANHLSNNCEGDKFKQRGLENDDYMLKGSSRVAPFLGSSEFKVQLGAGITFLGAANSRGGGRLSTSGKKEIMSTPIHKTAQFRVVLLLWMKAPFTRRT